MGRYAFFNTGFEYKFEFGSQHSSDILKFGGVFAEPDNGYIWWNKDNFKGQFEVDKYEKSLDGTYKLYNDDKKLADTEMLGALIYHQLLYTPMLECWFEW